MVNNSQGTSQKLSINQREFFGAGTLYRCLFMTSGKRSNCLIIDDKRKYYIPSLGVKID